jgi:hypothetical protein
MKEEGRRRDGEREMKEMVQIVERLKQEVDDERRRV